MRRQAGQYIVRSKSYSVFENRKTCSRCRDRFLFIDFTRIATQNCSSCAYKHRKGDMCMCFKVCNACQLKMTMKRKPLQVKNCNIDEAIYNDAISISPSLFKLSARDINAFITTKNDKFRPSCQFCAATMLYDHNGPHDPNYFRVSIVAIDENKYVCCDRFCLYSLRLSKTTHMSLQIWSKAAMPSNHFPQISSPEFVQYGSVFPETLIPYSLLEKQNNKSPAFLTHQTFCICSVPDCPHFPVLVYSINKPYYDPYLITQFEYYSILKFNPYHDLDFVNIEDWKMHFDNRQRCFNEYYTHMTHNSEYEYTILPS